MIMHMIHIYIYICMHIYIYIYIYMYKSARHRISAHRAGGYSVSLASFVLIHGIINYV